MKGILDEIKQQPPHIREIFMWVCVVITFSVIGFAWFRTTARQFAALVNPENVQTRALAEKNENQTESPFATLFISLKDLGANIFELFDFKGEARNFEIQKTQRIEAGETIQPQKLPLSEDR